jgi:hypothetical protein
MLQEELEVLQEVHQVLDGAANTGTGGVGGGGGYPGIPAAAGGVGWFRYCGS